MNWKFKSCQELLEWTKNTAHSLGYVIVTRRSKTYGNSFVHTIILICDHRREYKPKEYTCRASGSKRTNCQFQLEGKYSKEHDKWMLRVICDEHNHPPTQHMEGHPFARWLSVDETRLVDNLTRKNVQNENNVSTIKTIYNAQQKIRMHEQAGRTPIQVVMSLLHTNDYVYEFTTRDSNELENLFFVHPTSWKIWRAFPHVLIIDATYKTNKYNKPLVQIVGMTSTQKTFSVGFSFIHREKEANYTCVLNCLNSTLDTCMHPCVIIIDIELALINACETVFPDAARLLCRWHIEQNILKHCNKIIMLEDDRCSFRSLWNLLVESPTLMDYTENYMQLQSMLIKYPHKLYKEMFVCVWIHQHLNFRNNTTNRVESAHANLKRFLDSANSNLNRFVQRFNEIVHFEKSLIFQYKHHNLYCFGLLRGFVSNEALDIIFGELQRLNVSKLDSSNCGCKLRTSCGLPCACMLSVYSNLVFLTRRMKKGDICCDDEVENQKQEKKYLKKLKKIYDPRTIDIGEPTVQNNTCGRPSMKKQHKKNVNPPNQAPPRCNDSTTSEFIGLELNKEPERHNSSYDNDLNEVPQMHDPFLMKSIPDVFHDYIDNIQDVLGDENRRYRAFFTNGFNEVYESLCWFESPTYLQHWMIMPLTGYLIANKFGVIVHCQSHEQSTTCFPLWRGPEEFQSHRSIIVALVGRHNIFRCF
uniref:MULE transposase domain-containing protein n=1 Tax=Lactuca sativa TaxID=4236 RepID=A0A9R1WUF6_LACSA|nr:hypothetical protein LSAT_V11C900487460 [Lactuca sativa]